MLFFAFLPIVLALSFFSGVSLASSPNEEAEFLFKKGMENIKTSNYEEAQRVLTEAVLLSLETHKYHQALFFHYLKTRRGPLGIKFYEDLIIKYPNSSIVHYWLGRFYLQRRTLDQAAREFKEATRLAPEDDHGFIALGHATLELGNVEDAYNAYRRANELAPKVAVVHEGLGNIYYRKKDYSKAKMEYDLAIKLDASLNEARYNLGLIHEKNGDIGKAIGQWKAILESDPNEAQARERLARIYFLGEQYSDAAREYSMITKVRPFSTDIFLALGESLIMAATVTEDPAEMSQMKESAIQAFREALELDPENPTALEYIEKLSTQEPVPG